MEQIHLFRYTTKRPHKEPFCSQNHTNYKRNAKMANVRVESEGGNNWQETILGGARHAIRGAGALMHQPEIVGDLAKAAFTGDFSSEAFRSPEMVAIIAAANTERTKDIRKFPTGPKVIIANHTTPSDIFSAIAARLPAGEFAPYMPADAGDAILTHTSNKRPPFNPMSLITRRFAQMILTAPNIQPSLSPEHACQKDELLQNAAEITGGKARVHVDGELVRKIRQIQENEPDASFLIFIEGQPSRGEELKPAARNTTILTNLILRGDPNARIHFLAHNTTTGLTHNFEVRREGLQRMLPPEFFDENLRYAMDQTRSLSEEI